MSIDERGFHTDEDLEQFIARRRKVGVSPAKIYKDFITTFRFKSPEHKENLINRAKKLLNLD